jgi:hypothetical protein
LDVPIDTEHRLVVIAIPESMVGRAFKQEYPPRLHNIWGGCGEDVLMGKPVLFPDARVSIPPPTNGWSWWLGTKV